MKKNQIINRLSENFSISPNQLINDSSMSPITRFAFILMNAQAPGFRFWNNWMMQQLHISDERTLNKYLKPLIMNGYLKRYQDRSEGKFNGYYYELNHQPTALQNLPHGNLTAPEENRPGTDAGHNNTKLPNKTKEINKTEESQTLFQAPTYDEVVVIMSGLLSRVSGNVTIDAWAKWEATEFITYWTGRKWKRGRNYMKDIPASCRNWLKTGVERAKYTKPAPGSPGYGKFVQANVSGPEIDVNDNYVSPLDYVETDEL